jgi:hypothetical protein
MKMKAYLPLKPKTAKPLTALLAVLAVLMLAGTARANPGDSWILPIAFTQGGGWTTLTGAGYNGTDAMQASGMDGVRRIYWKLDPSLLSVGTGNLMPAGTTLYTISWYRPSSGAANWQPIESQISGSAGEVWPIDSNIPWVGAFGSNHEYIGADGGTPGTWVAAGPGPHTPESADYNAGANGIYMWLKNTGNMDTSSWLYAKWDYGWSIDHAWSALMLTQIPEPSALALGLLGGFVLLLGFRRASH